MKSFFLKHWKGVLSLLVGITVFLFWYLAFPHALSYQEQYQLFLFSGDYVKTRLSVPGGLAELIGEFLVQFYYVEWAGALVLALVAVAVQRLTWLVMRRQGESYVLSFVPVMMLMWLWGDPIVTLSFAVAVLIATGAALIDTKSTVANVLIVSVVYLVAGPMAWFYVALRLLRVRGWAMLIVPLWLLVLMLVVYNLWLTQWPLMQVVLPLQFNRGPFYSTPVLWLMPLSIVAVAGLAGLLSKRKLVPLQAVLVAVLAFAAISQGYDRDMFEIIRMDYLVRNERWDDIISRAREYEVRSPIWSNSVNLALAKKRQLAEHQFDFYQSGKDALVGPKVTDLTSMLPSAEAYWHLGMINTAQRHMFDTQESILNARTSGRCTKRIAECMIVNGHYSVARKHIGILKKTLFYRQWALEAEKLIDHPSSIDFHSVYGQKRRMRYKQDFLFNYPEIGKMFGLLFVANNENKMALDYFMSQMALDGNLNEFCQYLGYAQRYGGYESMPACYRDIANVAQHGPRTNSPFASYARKMFESSQQNLKNR